MSNTLLLQVDMKVFISMENNFVNAITLFITHRKLKHSRTMKSVSLQFVTKQKQGKVNYKINIISLEFAIILN